MDNFFNLIFSLFSAIGSDNALIYYKALYFLSNQDGLNPSTNHQQLEKEFRNTLNHVLKSSFCASLTTCGAFFAGYFINITSLKCFSIFSGLSIIANFFITTATFPSTIIISRWIDRNGVYLKYFKLNILPPNDCFQLLFNKFILKIIFNYYHYLTIILSIVSLISISIVFYKPGLQLPNNNDFQLYTSDHIFERYDLEYRNRFWYSRLAKIDTESNSLDVESSIEQSNFVLPMRIIFGILPQDNGNCLNPADRGKLVFDPDFDISNQRSQEWLLEFCQEIRAQTFYRPTLGPLLTNCFIETLQSWMSSRKCMEIVGNNILDNYPCCELTKFPYKPETFNQCTAELIGRLHRTPNFIINANQAGPRFNATNGQLRAMIIEYDSIYDGFTHSFETVDQVWQRLNQWMTSRLAMAPKELKNGWFVTGNLEFYALQRSITSGVASSLFISVLFAFIALMFTTMNLRYSIISIISISFVIFTSIAALILLGWRLNIIESIVISLTIGLAIDATLHYTIAYKMFIKQTVGWIKKINKILK